MIIILDQKTIKKTWSENATIWLESSYRCMHARTTNAIQQNLCNCYKKVERDFSSILVRNSNDPWLTAHNTIRAVLGFQRSRFQAMLSDDADCARIILVVLVLQSLRLEI